MKTKPLLICSCLVTGLLVASCSSSSENSVKKSSSYIQAPVQDVVDEWMTARNGTIKASGGDKFYYGGNTQVAAVDTTSTDMRYDLPGNHCSINDSDKDSAKAYLNVSTDPQEIENVDVDAELQKVSDYWKPQGWTDIRQGAGGKYDHQIMVTTPLGTQLLYTVMYKNDSLMRVLQMDSLCADEFGNTSPNYLGDFNNRYTQAPTPTAVSEESR